MVKKFELNEDEFKKILLILKHSKEFVKLDPKDLFLGNLWRVAPKLAEKIAKRNGYEFVESNGRKTLKPIGEVEVKPTEEKLSEVEIPKEEVASESPAEVTEQTEEQRVPRCRKRKRKS